MSHLCPSAAALADNCGLLAMVCSADRPTEIYGRIAEACMAFV
jgi:hypothetical protein